MLFYFFRSASLAGESPTILIVSAAFQPSSRALFVYSILNFTAVSIYRRQSETVVNDLPLVALSNLRWVPASLLTLRLRAVCVDTDSPWVSRSSYDTEEWEALPVSTFALGG